MIRLAVIGNLTRDPETRTVQRGETDGKVTNFTIAASVSFGEYKRTEFIRVSAWNGIGQTCMKYLTKGSKVYAAGPVSVNTYVNSDGQAVGNLELRLDEVEFLSSRPAETVAPSVPSTANEEEDIEDLL